MNFITDHIFHHSATARRCAGLSLGIVMGIATVRAVGAAAGDASDESQTLQEIIVTAEKRAESVVSVPETVNVLSAQTLTNLNVQSFDDYATKIPNLSFNNGQLGIATFANARGVTIRGVVGPDTTSLYIDDTPIPITQDPRIVDVARIEVLKGPQGTLYGSSAIGGTIRLITNEPSLDSEDSKLMVQSGLTEHGGSADYGGTVMTNIVIEPDRLAVRLMGFVNHDAGYVTRNFPTTDGSDVRASQNNTGEDYQEGGSISALLKITDEFTARLMLLGQRTDYPTGLPLVYRGVPNFDDVSLTEVRDYNSPESSSAVWYLPALTLEYKGDWWDLVSSTSTYSEKTHDVEDVSEAMHQLLDQPDFGDITNFGSQSGGDQEFESDFQEEIRLNFHPIKNFNGLIGLYDARNISSIDSATRVIPGVIGMTTPYTGLILTDVYYHGSSESVVAQKAIFGSFDYTLDRITATVGVRRYWIDLPANLTSLGFIVGANVPVTTTSYESNSGYSPKFSLSFAPSSGSNIYASAAKGFRPGGPGQILPPQCDAELATLGQTPGEVANGYKPDSVWSYELGAKQSLADQHILITGAVYDTEWKDIQQNVALNSCGNDFTGNAGAARIRGVELEFTGEIGRDLSVRAGYGYTDARITNDADGTTAQPVGSRLYGTPQANATVSATYSPRLTAELRGYFSADWSYTGSSLSANNSTLTPAVLNAYDLLNLRVGVRKDRRELSLYVNNMFDRLAVLGDSIPDIARTITIDGQSVPYNRVYITPPRTIGLQYRQGF